MMMIYRLLVILVIGLTQVISTTAVAAEIEPAARGRPVAQKCLKALQAFDQKLWRVGFGILLSYGPSVAANSEDFDGFSVAATPREKIRALHGAAYVYAYSGDEQLCQQTLTSMQAIFYKHQKLFDKPGNDSNARMAWRRAHLLRAKPIAQMNHILRASIVIGAEIHNLNDERLGEITDIVLNPETQSILYVLASQGGVFGIGGKLVAVPWSDLRATEDHTVYVLDVPPKTFGGAPTVNRTNFAATATPGWQDSLTRYWDNALKK